MVLKSIYTHLRNRDPLNKPKHAHNLALVCAFFNIGLYLISTHIPTPHLGIDQYSLHLSSLHNIPLDLQLAAHKQLLRIRLARNQLPKVLVAQHERDGGLLARGRGALADCAGLLEVDEPRVGLP